MKRVVLITIALAVVCAGAAGVAGADSVQSENGEWQTTADGEYEQNADTETSDSGTWSDSGGATGTYSETSDNGDTAVAITASPPGDIATYASNGTIRAFTGVLNTTGTLPQPIAGDDITIEIKAPDGTVTTYNETTDANGSAVVAYNLTNRADGRYTLTVTHDSTGVQTSIDVFAGVSLEETTSGSTTYIGEETTVAFLARNGSRSVSNLSVDLQVTRDGQVVTNRTAKTDENGFVNISFTPQTQGRYRIEASADNVALGNYGETLEAVNYSTETDIFNNGPVTQGQPATYFGRLTSSNGVVPNTTLVIEFTDLETGENFTVTTETNARGFYHADYQVPSDADDLSVDIQTADGEPVGVHDSFISMRSAPTSGGDGGSDPTFVDFSLSTDSYRAQPGETVNATLEATDGGEPITNQQVEIVFYHGWRSAGPPIISQTVTTDENGLFTAQLPIPSNAIDDGRLTAVAAMTYQNDTYETSTGVSVQQYEVDDFAFFEPGKAAVNVTDRATGEPVEGFPVQYDEQYDGHRTGSYATGALSTNASGADEETYPVPEDAGFYLQNNVVHRYAGTNHFYGIFPDYEGTLNVGQTTAAPGETVTVQFDLPDGVTADGMVYGHLGSPDTPIAADLDSDGNATITVPENATAGARLDLGAWAIDENGTLYQDRDYGALNIEQPKITIEGQLVMHNGSAAADDGVAIFTDGEGWNATHTDENGNFSLTVPATETPNTLLYNQGNGTDIPDDYSDMHPRDGNVDTHVTQVSGNESTDIGALQLPKGHLVNVTILDENRDPVDNASVTFLDREEGTDAEGGWILTDSINGTPAGPDGTVFPGLEMNGSTTIHVDPPENDSRFVDRRYTTNLTVNGSESLEFVLEEVPTATFDVTPDSPAVNETVTFNASNSTAVGSNVEEYVWEFGDGTTLTTNNSTVSHTYNESGEYNVTLTVRDGDGAENTTTTAIKVGGPSVADYANENDVVDTEGLRTAVGDWRTGDIDTQLLRDVISAWRSGEPV